MNEGSAPVNRHPSDPAWRAVDDYFTRSPVSEDAVLVVTYNSGVQTTMPNAEVAFN